MTDPKLIQYQIADLVGSGGRKLDLDKEVVEVVAIVCASTVAVCAMIFDGSVGDAIGTVLLTGGASWVSYLIGLRKCEAN